VRVAGVRLPDGRAIWADAAGWELVPPCRVLLRLPEGEVAGVVFVSPEQLLRPVPEVEGTVVAVQPRPDDDGGEDLPGSDLPYLGSSLTVGGRAGLVTGLDPVRRTVTLTMEDGDSVELPEDDWRTS
jgi:hypothetical protein